MRKLFLVLISCVSLSWAEPPIRIMPLGDSITQGNSDHNSYRRSLYKKLIEAGYAVDFVGSLHENHGGGPPLQDFDMDHEGHWGWTVDEVLAQLGPWVEAAMPDVVLIHLGSNDIYRGEGVESTIAELRAMVDLLRSKNPKVAVWVAKIIPYRGSGDDLLRFNASIQSLAATNVHVVDLNTGFEVSIDTYDGLHPNEAGEEKMADGWFQTLSVFLPKN